MEQLNPGHSPLSARTSSSKLLYWDQLLEEKKMHPLIGFLNYLRLTNLQMFEEFPAGCNPSFLCCPQYPSPFNLHYSCSCRAPDQAAAPSRCPGGWQEERGFLRVQERFPAPRSVVHAPISLWRSSRRENPIWFLHPWRCCIPTNRKGRAPDQRRQGRRALVGQTVPSAHSAVPPAYNSPHGTSDRATGFHRTAGATAGCHGNTASLIPNHCPEE